MKKHILLFAFFICQTVLLAQAGLQLQYKLCSECPTGDMQSLDYTYDVAPCDYGTSHVESDYDMRITNGSRYHQGIDFLPRADCQGDAVLSVEGGTVAFVKGNGNLKNIVVQNGARAFVYMHLFRDGGVPATGMRSGRYRRGLG